MLMNHFPTRRHAINVSAVVFPGGSGGSGGSGGDDCRRAHLNLVIYFWASGRERSYCTRTGRAIPSGGSSARERRANFCGTQAEHLKEAKGKQEAIY